MASKFKVKKLNPELTSGEEEELKKESHEEARDDLKFSNSYREKERRERPTNRVFRKVRRRNMKYKIPETIIQISDFCEDIWKDTIIPSMEYAGKNLGSAAEYVQDSVVIGVKSIAHPDTEITALLKEAYEEKMLIIRDKDTTNLDKGIYLGALAREVDKQLKERLANLEQSKFPSPQKNTDYLLLKVFGEFCQKLGSMVKSLGGPEVLRSEAWKDLKQSKEKLVNSIQKSFGISKVNKDTTINKTTHVDKLNAQRSAPKVNEVPVR